MPYSIGTEALERDVAAILKELIHVSYLFPENSNESITFTAGAVADTFSDWAEIVDNNAVTFSSKIANNDGHISSAQIESTDTTDKVYIIEIAYGDAKTGVVTHRFASGVTVFLPPVQQIRFRPERIPKGETVYYRMKCATGGAVCTVSFRYHYR